MKSVTWHGSCSTRISGKISRVIVLRRVVRRVLPLTGKVALMSHFSIRSLIVGITFAALAAATPAANAQVLDPGAFASSGSLSLASGVYTLDTDALTFNGYSGVLSNGIAVFDFSSINVGANATVNVVGSHPLALLSQSDATFGAGSSFNLNGGNGGNGQHNFNSSGLPAGGAGGIAGAGGYKGADGFGGSTGNTNNGPGGNSSGGGGGFGGVGRGYGFFGILTSNVYGNLLTKLEGGSGGGGTSGTYGGGQAISGSGGGGGGGAIEINALGSLTLAGSLNANGGLGGGTDYDAGGAGAGGGVLLAGNRVVVTGAGQINANGGGGFYNSFVPTHSSGGGGGGRITVQTLDPNGFIDSGALKVNGGFVADAPAINGDMGVITVNGRVTNTPAPGSLLVAVLGAVPVVAALRRRRK